MTEIVDPDKEVIRRMREILMRGRSAHDVTQAYIGCSAIVLWALQAVRDPRRPKVKESFKRAIDDFTQFPKVSENENFEDHAEINQLKPTERFDVLIAIRDCFAHLDQRKVSFENHDSALQCYKLWFYKRSDIPNDFDVNTHCQNYVVLNKSDLKELGKSVADAFLRAVDTGRTEQSSGRSPDSA